MTQNTMPMISSDPEIDTSETTDSSSQLAGEGIQPWSMDTYADRLMDDLFEEVDHILAGGEPRTSKVESEPQLPAPKPALKSPPKGLPPVLASQFSLHQKPADEAIDDLLSEVTHPSDRRHQQNRWLDGLLLGSIVASIIATALIWLSNRQEMSQFFAHVLKRGNPSNVSAIAQNPKAQADLHFIDYVQRSLEAIAQSNAGTNASADRVATVPGNKPGEPSATNLPTVAVNKNAAQPNNSPNVLERVYIPVYQPPQGIYAPQGAQLPVPPANIISSAPAATVTVPGKIANSPVANAPAKVHTLVGILNLGKKSAALFEIDGESQRLYAGERIGESGWTLVKILDQEAVIRRNGEVRSIYVGQQF